MPSISPVPSSTVNGTIRSAQATAQIERLIPDGPKDRRISPAAITAALSACSASSVLRWSSSSSARNRPQGAACGWLLSVEIVGCVLQYIGSYVLLFIWASVAYLVTVGIMQLILPRHLAGLIPTEAPT